MVFEFLSSGYLVIKALHILSFIAWMAGLLYLPRLFVYQAENPDSLLLNAVFSTMAYRLLYWIMTPAMTATFFFGGLLVWIGGSAVWGAGWFWGKCFAVVVLSGFHGASARWRRAFQAGENKKSPRFFRMMNEIPFLLAIIIVFFVVLKPF